MYSALQYSQLERLKGQTSISLPPEQQPLPCHNAVSLIGPLVEPVDRCRWPDEPVETPRRGPGEKCQPQPL